jgi:hypothetical protein
MRIAVAFLLCVWLFPGSAAPEPDNAPAAPEYVQAVEFPYYLYPRAQWERELVWLKNIGVRTIEFSIPWNWHQLEPGDFDFTGRTSPRRDLAGLIHILRRLELMAWVRPMPPVPGWNNAGWPSGGGDARAQRLWLQALEQLLAPQTEKHGGPIAFVQGRELTIDAAPPPAPLTTLSATETGALARSREAMSAGRALLWQDVEETLYPAGWEPAGVPLLHPGSVELSGKEGPTAALRRDAALLHNWAAVMPTLRPIPLPRRVSGSWPKGVAAAELISSDISAVSILNQGQTDFHEDVRVREPGSEHVLVIPGVSVPRRESLWLPLNISLSPSGLCHECSNFSRAERIVYATAELLTVEFENGILAMEFAAPQPAEVVLQLARKPVGPYLAGGKPVEFDWDERTLRATLPIPAGTAAGNHVRVGLAIAAPETSGFFSDARRLVIGEKNAVPTIYSSAEVASRSRLRVPEGFSSTATVKTPNEIEYAVGVPPDAVHGDYAGLALEADGMLLGRARVQLFRPASLHVTQAIPLHFGAQTSLMVEPPTAPVETRGGSDVEVVIRNNSTEIRTYRLEPSGSGLDFSPAKTEITIAGTRERPVSFRVFGEEGGTGLRNWFLHVRGGADLDVPLRAILLPRAGTVAWTADLDGDGYPEWVLESQKLRAIFSSRDGGRWMEFTWKDTGTNFLPSEGAFAQPGSVGVRVVGNSLQLSGTGWTRTISLEDTKLTIEQSPALPANSLASKSVGNLDLSVGRPSASRLIAEIRQSQAEP